MLQRRPFLIVGIGLLGAAFLLWQALGQTGERGPRGPQGPPGPSATVIPGPTVTRIVTASPMPVRTVVRTSPVPGRTVIVVSPAPAPNSPRPTATRTPSPTPSPTPAPPVQSCTHVGPIKIGVGCD